MTDATPAYRWNTSAAAEAYDQAAPAIHPYYQTIQDQILDQLPFETDAALLLVDLGGGSGRFIERLLARFPNAQAVLIDQSEPFLALAQRRLTRFADRALLIKRRLQDDWPADLPARPQAIVSTSAIHHLDPSEKRTLFARCFAALAPGGVFLNGDEFRPESDAAYLAQLTWWAEHMQSAQERGLIPASFQPVFEAWYDRNIRHFSEPKKSGDDCPETVAEQQNSLESSGFVAAEILWKTQLWAVVRAHKPFG